MGGVKFSPLEFGSIKNSKRRGKRFVQSFRIGANVLDFAKEESSRMFLGLNEKTKNESGGMCLACAGRA